MQFPTARRERKPMSDHKILFTGDFWHSDFQSLLSEFEVPVTLVSFEKAKTLADSGYDLVVIAQARRDQHSAGDVQELQTLFSTTPVVALLGSWCEGETRSGTPWPGIERVYWHQWKGRYQKFADQLEQHNITDWHSARTSTIADQVVNSRSDSNDYSNKIRCVAISAWTNHQHAMVADAINHFGWSSCWVERAAWNAETAAAVDVIVIEADAWSSELGNRVKWVQRQVDDCPIVLIANYPRQDNLKEINAAGVSEVISKPFELDQLKSAIMWAVESRQQSVLRPAVV